MTIHSIRIRYLVMWSVILGPGGVFLSRIPEVHLVGVGLSIAAAIFVSTAFVISLMRTREEKRIAEPWCEWCEDRPKVEDEFCSDACLSAFESASR